MSGVGFGDHLSIDELIASKEALLQIMAVERQVPAEMFDDTVQEARIAVWETADRPPAYQHAAARMRIREVAARQTWTGHSRVHGQPTDPLRNSERSGLGDTELAIVARDLLDGAEWAYHHGELMDALCALPLEHRQYVYMRFWLGSTEPEIAAVVGKSYATVQRWWTTAIKPSLRARLGHLRVEA